MEKRQIQNRHRKDHDDEVEQLIHKWKAKDSC